MSGPKPRRATYQDLLDAPPHVVAELVDGELHLSPRPTLAHATLVQELARELARLRGPGGWILLIEPELYLGHDVLVPALAGWRRDRLPPVEDRPGFAVAPDWLCEVLSLSTEKLDRAQKLPIYAAHGVGHAWLVNAAQRFVEVLRRTGERWLSAAVHRDGERLRAAPFEAVELPLARLWADLGSPVTSCEGGAAEE